MSENPNLCPICEKGALSSATHSLNVKHGNRFIAVSDLEHSVCDSCDEEPVLTAQIRRNQRKIADAKRSVDNLMSGAEICAMREQFGLTQQRACVLFGGGANAFSKYERGEVIQSVAMDRLLKAAVFFPELVGFLEYEADVVSVENGRLAVSAYQDAATANMDDKIFSSRTVRGNVIEIRRPEWTRPEAA